jgi:hypothetical protein
MLILMSGGLNCKHFVRLLVYCLYPDDGSKSGPNMYSNIRSDVTDVHLLGCYVSTELRGACG